MTELFSFVVSTQKSILSQLHFADFHLNEGLLKLKMPRGTYQEGSIMFSLFVGCSVSVSVVMAPPRATTWPCPCVTCRPEDYLLCSAARPPAAAASPWQPLAPPLLAWPHPPPPARTFDPAPAPPPNPGEQIKWWEGGVRRKVKG